MKTGSLGSFWNCLSLQYMIWCHINKNQLDSDNLMTAHVSEVILKDRLSPHYNVDHYLDHYSMVSDTAQFKDGFQGCIQNKNV